MRLFQQTVLKKQLLADSTKIRKAYELYSAYFLNPEIQENIRNSKEEQFQEGFLRELFVKILGYTLNPEPNYNLITEKKNEADSKKADGAILVNGEVKAVIELKDHKTTDLKQVEAQAFGYKNNHRKASYVIISNFEKLRFYIENTIDFEEFNLFGLTEDDFAVLWICLAYENIAADLPKRLKSESTNGEDQITKKLYQDYSSFKQALFENILTNNKGIHPLVTPLVLFKKTQKLLDRFLFVFFAEDKGLLPPNSMKRIIDQWSKRNDDPLNEYQPLYVRFKLYFKYMNEGHKGKAEDIFGYNGGLFKSDEILEAIAIDDDVLRKGINALVVYDFDTEVDVNILGHIFEHSLSEIEEITNALSDKGMNPLAVSKRKKDGVFYTPRYITTYIVENTLGKLCAEKKTALAIDESEYFADKKRPKTQTKRLSDKLTDYREWLLSLTVCDPACGSGAFLNAALDFLMTEHRLIDELTAKLFGNAIVFPNIENAILENNLYGVDINDESVEIAKLALWLRTAKPQRKLNSLNNNIKCGNSLISPPSITRGFIPLLDTEIEKAFDWHKEFPQVFSEKCKIAYHVTTAIHDSRTSQRMIDYKVREMRAKYNKGINPLAYASPQFMTEEDELIITKTILEIVKEDELNVLAYNICRDHLHILLVCEAEELDKIVGKIKGKTSRTYNLHKGINPLVKEESERSIPLWTQKFGYKEVTTSEQLYNTIEYIEKNRTKHELPANKGIHPLAEEMLCTIDYAFRPEYKGGFDVVIGNPPYVLCQPSNTPENILNYYKQFEVASYKIDLFHLFFERGVNLLKPNGKLGYITPNTYLTNIYIEKLRNYLLKNTISNLTLNSKEVFADASVDVCTIVIDKQKPNDNQVAIYNMNEFGNLEFVAEILQSQWENNSAKTFNVQKQFEINTENTRQLGDIASVTFGLQTKDKSTYVKETKEDDNWELCYTGRDISRYNLQEAQLFFKNCPAEVKAGGSWDMKIHHSTKIVVRQIGAPEPIFAFDKYGYATLNTMYSIVLNEKDFSYSYLLAILSSSLMKKWWLSRFSDNKDLFPKIKGSQLKEIPIKNIPEKEQQPFIDLADKMLFLNSKLQTKRQRFLKRLSDNFTVSTDKGINPLVITGTLARFDELDFKQFIAELAKQKIALSLKLQDEWEEYFNEYKTECRNFVNQINATDKEIDRMVYELYGLTEEEIKIIEK